MTREGHTVGGTSIMGLMMLAAGQGHTILIEAEGAEAPAALEALIKLVEVWLRRRGLGALVAGQHGADQVLVMGEAGKHHRGDMGDDQARA